jgi:hypothetical protein
MEECTISFISLSSPPSCPHLSHYAQPKDTPLRFLVLTLTIVYNMDSRCCNKSSPSQMHLDFYMPYFYSSDLFCLHHSSTSTPHIIYPFLKQHIYSIKSLVQGSTMTSLVVQTNNKKKKKLYQKKRVALLLHSTSYLTFHCQLHKPLINAKVPSTIHSLV